MYQEKIIISNQKKENIVGILTLPDKKKSYPLIIGLHGFGGNKENFLNHWDKTFKLLLDEGYGSFVFDFTNNIGESSGNIQNITIGKMAQDTQNVIVYFQKKSYIQKQHISLLGYSLGGTISVLTASSVPLPCLIMIAPVFHFQTIRTLQIKDAGVQAWKNNGYTFMKINSSSTPEKINYTFYEEAMYYDMPKIASKIHCPVLILHGDLDQLVPLNQSYDLARNLLCEKELTIIENGDHAMTEPEQQKRIANKILIFCNQHLKHT